MSKKFTALVFLFILVLLAPLLPACSHTPAATAYTAIIPAILQSGSKQAISIALFANDSPTSGKVDLLLLKDGQSVAQSHGTIKGSGEVSINIPETAEGEYTLQVKGDSFQDEATVNVANNYVVFLETDKPIYKPGQSIYMRLITLDSGLQAASEPVTVEVLDAKGIKIFRSEVNTDEFGLSSLELPISSEPNLGTWKIKATTAKSNTEIDVQVEEYVLPKYEIRVDLPKDWFLINEPIQGKITATYSFGKPVTGTLTIKATKYVGTWQEYAHLDLNITDGEAEFTVPAAEYVAGIPAAEGNGNVKLEYTVTETSTGYEEKTDSLLTVSQSAVNLQIIPSGVTFKPGLPYRFLVVTETPDNQLVDTEVNIDISYLDNNYDQIDNEEYTPTTQKGKALIDINPPEDCIAMTINCSSPDTSATKTIESAYSPSGNFIHLEQTSEGTPQVGENISFWVYSTRKSGNLYYEVISRGRVVFSSFVQGNEINLTATPAMAPSAKLLVYQILPNSEIAADYLPFQVTPQYPQNVNLDIDTEQAQPGQEVEIIIQTEGEAEVGLAAVDKSVFILAENRMNLQQVFDELEKLYMDPQAELHEVTIYDDIDTPGAQDVFKEAGVVVLSNQTIPEGKKYESPFSQVGMMREFNLMDGKGIFPPALAGAVPIQNAVPAPAAVDTSGLAEVQRIRQFFPETWIWDTIKTGSNGKATLNLTVPDTITTWMLRAVSISKSAGLGIAENQLQVFQPFFLSADLPYSAIRNEEFPVSVAVYNYLDQPQDIVVNIEESAWFELLDQAQKTINVQSNDIEGVKFQIKPTQLGTNEVKITARSSQAADAVVKTLIVEAEGAARENVNNISLSSGQNFEISTAVPDDIVEGSARAYFAVTSNYLTQTLDGLDSLIQMPFGCGEQNMIIFAPDVYITKYLKESGQLKPEILAKAEKLMLTGYQRELTYRRTDGSFSAFGQSDAEGSLWLTAFVLKCFSEAKGLIYIDDEVLGEAKAWILDHRNADGSYAAVGFIHHQDMLGGLKGQTALSAYVAIALLQAGDQNAAQKTITYLEKQLSESDDSYTVALIAYALELAGSEKSEEAHTKLMELAKEDENGLYWGDEILPPLRENNFKEVLIDNLSQTSTIETTAYAALALIGHGDNLNASRSAKWLVSQRNSSGGFGSTQDTVMALQALIEYSAEATADVNLKVSITTSSSSRQIRINQDNFDILQIVEVPVNSVVTISAEGEGEAIGQIVQRFNIPDPGQEDDDILKVNVDYDADEVAVNDEVAVSVSLSFNPPEPMEAGMTVVDVAVPTGFTAVKESIDQAVSSETKIKRYDISGRKVIFYIENLYQGDSLAFSFKVQALYPVKAQGVTSRAYSYYQPEITAESQSQPITIVDR